MKTFILCLLLLGVAQHSSANIFGNLNKVKAFAASNNIKGVKVITSLETDPDSSFYQKFTIIADPINSKRTIDQFVKNIKTEYQAQNINRKKINGKKYKIVFWL